MPSTLSRPRNSMPIAVPAWPPTIAIARLRRPAGHPRPDEYHPQTESSFEHCVIHQHPHPPLPLTIGSRTTAALGLRGRPASSGFCRRSRLDLFQSRRERRDRRFVPRGVSAGIIGVVLA